MMNLKGEYPPAESFSGLGGVCTPDPPATGGRLTPWPVAASAARVLEEHAEEMDDERERGGEPEPCPFACPGWGCGGW